LQWNGAELKRGERERERERERGEKWILAEEKEKKNCLYEN
jgi:hypothetical protein